MSCRVPLLCCSVYCSYCCSRSSEQIKTRSTSLNGFCHSMQSQFFKKSDFSLSRVYVNIASVLLPPLIATAHKTSREQTPMKIKREKRNQSHENSTGLNIYMQFSVRIFRYNNTDNYICNFICKRSQGHKRLRSGSLGKRGRVNVESSLQNLLL